MRGFLVMALGVATAATVIAACSKATPHDAQFDGTGILPPVGGGTTPPVTTGDGGGGIVGPLGDGAAGSCVLPTIVDAFVPTRTLYLAASPIGNDSNDGLTPSTAWASLVGNNNAAKLRAGDEVQISDGTYPCGAVITAQGTAAAPVWLHATGNPPNAPKAMFQCSTEYGFDIQGATYLAIDGVTIQNASTSGIRIGNALGSSVFPDHIFIGGSVIAQSAGAGIFALGATNVDIRKTEITQASFLGPRVNANGIDLVSVSGANLLANLVHDQTTNAAIAVRAGSQNVLLDGNALSNLNEAIRLGSTSARTEFIGAGAAAAAYEASGAVAVNNIIFGTVSLPFILQGCASCFISNNTVSVRGATSLVQSLSGGVGPSASFSASQTTNLTIRNDIFNMLTAPARLFTMPISDTNGFNSAYNLFSLDTGSVTSVLSTPPIDGTGVLTDVKPNFSAAAQNNYQLGIGSPAVGRGIAAPEAVRDATGACRSEADIGAY